MIYTYRCTDCGTEDTATLPVDRLPRVCRGCGAPGPLHRVFGFSHKPGMEEHFNNTVNKPVSSMRQFEDELKRAGDEASAQTGIPHRYVPVDWGDKEALGVTNEGIHESNVARSKMGAPLLPDLD